ncbi:MAG: hypothetical protein D3926_09745 [Desulfobacteraceae bacterium]|nr:MAG: hypothetical protein D3926_09745 [Desulfobacteraceae bacterium]
MRELDQLNDTWIDNGSGTEKAFTQILEHLKTLPDTDIELVARPGISYSIRPKHASQTERALFAMVDVIDDEPEERWLSVCFYEDMISDPEEAGDLVPEGLLGSDGYCFDLYEYDQDEVNYIIQRLSQACASASA